MNEELIEQARQFVKDARKDPEGPLCDDIEYWVEKLIAALEQPKGEEGSVKVGDVVIVKSTGKEYKVAETGVLVPDLGWVPLNSLGKFVDAGLHFEKKEPRPTLPAADLQPGDRIRAIATGEEWPLVKVYTDEHSDRHFLALEREDGWWLETDDLFPFQHGWEKVSKEGE